MAFQADSIFWVEVEKIVPNPYQPRREFDEAKLKELSESVRMYGILQPLTVTRKEIQNSDGSFRSEYELIAGERRLRASKLAGLSLVPVIIRDGEQTEQEKLELAIIENLQREDLNAVDRALAFRQLADVFGLSHVQVAKKVGRSREYVSNSIRLLALPDYMLNSLRTNDITEGHARTLLMINDRPEELDVVFREILLKKLSVREVEKIVRGIAVEKVRRKDLVDDNILEIERQFTDALGTRVSIVKTEFGGRLTIDYFTMEELGEMLERMRKEAKEKGVVVSPVYRDESNDTKVSEEVDEAAAALAILTASVGLEAFPDRSHEPLVAVVPNEVPSVPQFIAESDPVPDMSSYVSPAVIVEEPKAEVMSVPVPSPLPTAVVVPVPVLPVTPAPMPSTPAPAAVSGRLSLRDQLASLLGNAAAVAPAPAPVAPVTPPPPLPVVTESRPTETTPVAKEDDSELYSINRFTI